MRSIKNIRLKNYDYSQNGYYFVTIGSHLGKPTLSHHKKLVEGSIESLSKTKGIKVDHYVVMDNHLHLILILEGCRLSLGEIIRRFKSTVSRKAGARMWQPNYYEHIIRNDAALSKIRKYIQANPMIAQIRFEEFYSCSPADRR